MAPSRGKAKAAVSRRTPPGRRTTRSRGTVNDSVPDVYSAMLDDVRSDEGSSEDRPLKKRRVTPRKPGQRETLAEKPQIPHSQGTSQSHKALAPLNKRQQTVEDSSESEAEELDFEDVDLDVSLEDAGDLDSIEDLSISIQSQHDASRSVPRRKPVGTIEKSHRLLVHKLHVLCLLGHCMFVNGRCNNVDAQRHLRPLLSAKTVSYLKPSKHDTQFQRNRSFLDGLQQAVEAFIRDYKVTSSGITRPRWDIDGVPQEPRPDAEPIDTTDFINAAQNLEGSQDMASQLFCAMLRSAGVEARIVCSLQPLPFTTVPKAATPKKPAKVRIMAIAPNTDLTRTRQPQGDTAVRGSRAIGNVPSARRRLGQPSFAEEPASSNSAPKKSAPVVKLSFPVFWVEAFNEASQKWVAIDPVVTNTINKATKLEPPASYELNQLTYAIGFEDDGCARDVTRRYAKAYNAKTRRHRVEASTDGAKWWKRAMRVFRRQSGLLDRDQVEDAEMAQKEAREGLPANILDFKDHPYYALERHLKRHEVIHPRREVGKVNAGTAAKARMEPVYRRKDVVSCKSADKWYRNGRELKADEQPLKHVPARSRRPASPTDQSREPGQTPTTALYAPFQTQLYVPPPVQRGSVPRNSFGNLDVYVPSMVPAGGTHIRHALTPQAAKLLRVDYADAVTGFQFKGRHGTAVIEGAVVASQYADAIRAVIDGLEYMVLEDEAKARSLSALKTWKRFLVGMRIAERVRAYGSSPSVRDNEDTQGDQATTTTFSTDEELLTAGHFSLRELDRRKPAARKRKAADTDSEEEMQSGVDSISDQEEGVFLPESDDAEHSDHRVEDTSSPHGVTADAMLADQETYLDNSSADQGGGFIVEDVGPNDEEGGGFVVEDSKRDDDYTHESPELGIHDIGGEHQQDMIMEIDARDNARSDHVTEESGQRVDEVQDVSSHVAEPAQEDEDDNDSMLSHDPEDDEAEPDWLESD